MEIVPLSALRDNYIWTLCESGRCVVVDPGDAAPVEALLAQRNLRLAAVLITHRHRDHVEGLDALLQRHDFPVYGPRSQALPQISHILGDGDHPDLAETGIKARVFAVPGHTEEHLAFLVGTALFCGDTLFGAGCGRLLGGTAAQLHASLRRLATLPPHTRIFSAHEYTLGNLRFAQAVEPDNPHIEARRLRCETLRGENQPTLPSTLEEELATNPFLRTDRPTVREAVERICGQELRDEAETFAALREWKDRF